MDLGFCSAELTEMRKKMLENNFPRSRFFKLFNLNLFVALSVGIFGIFMALFFKEFLETKQVWLESHET